MSATRALLQQFKKFKLLKNEQANNGCCLHLKWIQKYPDRKMHPDGNKFQERNTEKIGAWTLNYKLKYFQYVIILNSIICVFQKWQKLHSKDFG